MHAKMLVARYVNTQGGSCGVKVEDAPDDEATRRHYKKLSWTLISTFEFARKCISCPEIHGTPLLVAWNLMVFGNWPALVDAMHCLARPLLYLSFQSNKRNLCWLVAIIWVIACAGKIQWNVHIKAVDSSENIWPAWRRMVVQSQY
jgi:hypothetical protein